MKGPPMPINPGQLDKLSSKMTAKIYGNYCCHHLLETEVGNFVVVNDCYKEPLKPYYGDSDNFVTKGIKGEDCGVNIICNFFPGVWW